MTQQPAARIPFVADPPEDPQVRDVFERLRRRWPDGPVLHLYRLLGWSPGLVGPWLDFSSALRFSVRTPAALRELVIVRSGQLLGAEYEWKHHLAIAREAGVPEEKLHALADWRTSGAFDADEKALLALADDTALGAGASADTMRDLIARFSSEEIVEFVVTAGFYAGVARIVNSLAVPLESGYQSMIPKDS